MKTVVCDLCGKTVEVVEPKNGQPCMVKHKGKGGHWCKGSQLAVKPESIKEEGDDERK